jgi:hypothetical protein
VCSDLPFIGNNLRLPWYYYLYGQFAMIRGVFLMTQACVHVSICVLGVACGGGVCRAINIMRCMC